jgi:hypothetical protein
MAPLSLFNRSLRFAAAASLLFSITAGAADEPKPKPENTVTLQMGDPVAVQKFEHPPKFWISDVTDRSGNPQPMLVLKERGGIFLDRPPSAILKDSLEYSLKAANLLASDQASADLVVRVYVFHFGLASGSALDLFGKVEFSGMVKNPKTGESLEVKAIGTSIANGAVRKKNIQKNVQENIEAALRDATRNFVRGTQLKDAVTQLQSGDLSAPTSAPAATPN